MAQLQEPLLVTTLRKQIRRGAPLSLLSRIAGGEAEYRRIATTYDLRGTARKQGRPVHIVEGAKPAPENLLPAGQDRLLEVVTGLAQAGEEYPGSMALAKTLDCSWIVIERDLRRLARKGFIRVFHTEVEGRPIRQIAIAGTHLATASVGR
jgi:hypothetical protein